MSTLVHRRLAWAAGALGVLAAVAGSPYQESEGRIDVRALAGVVEREEDHVTAVELAQWIRERRDGLRIVDVRSQAEFDAFHVPGAERRSLDSLVRMPIAENETVVLYSEGGAHAAQAWVLLRARGIDRVYFLRGGLFEWIDQVMEPTIAENASPTERARFDSVAALSRYFDGTPRIGEARAADAVPLPGAGTAAAVARVSRRGC